MKRLHIALVYNTASLGMPDAAEDRAGMADLLHMIRNIARHPVRAAFTALGMALATAILVVSLFTRDTMEQLRVPIDSLAADLRARLGPMV